VEKLYLTERQDIIGPHENRSKFAEILAGYGAAQARTPDHPWQQLGTWILIGMTGRWQRTLALWEWANGWDGFSDMIVSTMISPPRELAGVYEGVDRLRSGGECYLLAPGPHCPTLADLMAAGVKGSLLVYERADVEPGTEEDYLEAVHAEWEPIATGHGYSLVGHYVAAKADGIVFTAWAAERAAHTALARAPEASRWRATRRRLVRGWQEELWLAAPGSRLAGPETAARF
jgi:hypothetical protein